MFKKLVSNLPFNPSLIENLPEFREQLRHERRLRKVGLLILLVAFIAQLFITFFPANSKITNSPNDLIRGGFSTRSDAYANCQTNNDNFQDILRYFDISCSNLIDDNTTTILPSSYGRQLFSLNRIGYGQQKEKLVTINQNSYWIRPLTSGAGLNSVSLKVLSGSNSKGVKYFILYNSGNLVFIGKPLTKPNCSPNLDKNCPVLNVSVRTTESDNADNTLSKQNSIVIYTLSATNINKYRINSYSMKINFGSEISYSNIKNIYGGYLNNTIVTWPNLSINSNQTITKSASFIIKDPIPNEPQSSTDPFYSNNQMITTYGNSVSVKVPMTFNKYFELYINNGVPSLDKYFSLIITFILIIFVSYMLKRNELIIKELEHVRNDYINGGGN